MAIEAGQKYSCAILDNGSMKCWGFNGQGQLGILSSDLSVGDGAATGNVQSDMGDSLPELQLGTGRTVASMGLGYLHSCAVRIYF